MMDLDVKNAIKRVLRGLRACKDTSNREGIALHRECFKKLWNHRHSGKPVSAVL